MKMEQLSFQRVERDRQVLTEDNPARFLFTLLSMAAQPDRANIYFDHEDLEWSANVWNLAAIAAAGDEEFTNWSKFYKHHSDSLKNGELELGTMGYRWFDRAEEWPRASVISRAILALKHADMARPGLAKKPSLHRSVQ